VGERAGMLAEHGDQRLHPARTPVAQLGVTGERAQA
jgi:hypothetical protein